MSTKSPVGMVPEKSPDLPSRLFRQACILAAVIAVFVWIFTKGFIYSIIFLLGAAISITSFMITVRLADRVLKKGKGKLLFFAGELSKVVAIIMFFVFFSPLSARAFVAFALGISIIIIAIILEGLTYLFRMRMGHGT